jgi:hypothetical protein
LWYGYLREAKRGWGDITCHSRNLRELSSPPDGNYFHTRLQRLTSKKA